MADQGNPAKLAIQVQLAKLVPKECKAYLVIRVTLVFQEEKVNPAKRDHKDMMVHKAHKDWKDCLDQKDQKGHPVNPVHLDLLATLVRRVFLD